MVGGSSVLLPRDSIILGAVWHANCVMPHYSWEEIYGHPLGKDPISTEYGKFAAKSIGIKDSTTDTEEVVRIYNAVCSQVDSIMGSELSAEYGTVDSLEELKKLHPFDDIFWPVTEARIQDPVPLASASACSHKESPESA